jgi:hypothetical protein
MELKNPELQAEISAQNFYNVRPYVEPALTWWKKLAANWF